MTLGQGIQIGPFYFSVFRFLVGAGIIRVFFRKEYKGFHLNSLDRLIIYFSIWAIVCCFFREDIVDTLINRLGLAYDTCGIYFLLRLSCQSKEDTLAVVCFTSIILFPVALEMLSERASGHNLFSFLGGVPETPAFRRGHFRAQGPFRHAILAGSVGSACLPFMIGIWKIKRNFSILGIFSCLFMIFSCGSSGPILSAMAGIGALFLWKIRHLMRLVRRVVIIGYIFLDLIMKAPAYFLLARIDIGTGGTGWHRAELIQTSINHINEWWLFGTDYTRHWMPYGVTWSPNHIDITNHYIAMGVRGGLLLMFLFIFMIWNGFTNVGFALKTSTYDNQSFDFFFWSIGASLFAHAATMISARYFDQSIIFLFLVLSFTNSRLNDKVLNGIKQQAL